MDLSPIRGRKCFHGVPIVSGKVAWRIEPLLLIWSSPLMRIAAILDRASRLPLHRQIYEQWRKGILTGRFRQGNPVPSTRELAATLEVSRSTVTVAYEQLIAEGYLETAHGSGTFVCRELPSEPAGPRHRPAAAPLADTPIRLSRYGSGLTEDFRPPTRS